MDDYRIRTEVSRIRNNPHLDKGELLRSVHTLAGIIEQLVNEVQDQRCRIWDLQTEIDLKRRNDLNQ